MRILIAEDDEASRMILEAAVRQLGHESVSANDGAEAWRLFQLGKVDAVISDRSMPVMDGFELCRRIRALPGSGYSYFIFLTSFSDKTGIRDGMSVGADDYLGKPLDFDELSARAHRGDAPDGTASTTSQLNKRNWSCSIKNYLLRRVSIRSPSSRAAASSPRTSRWFPAGSSGIGNAIAR